MSDQQDKPSDNAQSAKHATLIGLSVSVAVITIILVLLNTIDRHYSIGPNTTVFGNGWPFRYATTIDLAENILVGVAILVFAFILIRKALEYFLNNSLPL